MEREARCVWGGRETDGQARREEWSTLHSALLWRAWKATGVQPEAMHVPSVHAEQHTTAISVPACTHAYMHTHRHVLRHLANAGYHSYS